ncbi:DNA-directed RNA polymerase subunit D [uncultured archaeon]|nr:DNA-directed RNA polymerase subunit D [uncultured archaeon]HKJ96836.1 DNA-directed RNA polymerase subunit D [Thermoplasmataceae archaeon]
MPLKIIESSERFIRFSVDGISPSIANALRRTLVNDIPKLAIENVQFHHGQIRDTEGNVYDSSLPLFDEVVAHRLGLIPFKTDLKMNFRDECSCEGKGCPLCTVTYSINKLGPSEVLSSDLQAVDNPDLVASDPNIPIVKLSEKQAMLVSAEAILGRAKEHAKWQATSGVSYKYHREFTVDKEIFEQWELIKNSCPDAVLKEDKKSITFTDDVPHRQIVQLFEAKGVRIVEDDTRFVFKFETDGSLNALEVLDYALKRIPQRINTLLDSVVSTD